MTGEDQSFRQFMRNIEFGLWSGKEQDLVPTLNRVTGAHLLAPLDSPPVLTEQHLRFVSLHPLFYI